MFFFAGGLYNAQDSWPCTTVQGVACRLGFVFGLADAVPLPASQVGRDCDLLIGAATEAAMRDPAAVGSTGLAQLLAALQATGYLNWRTALLTRMAEGPDHPANGAAASQRKHDLTAQLKSRTRMARQASAKQGTGSRTAERSAYNDNGTSSALVPARALAAT